MRMIETSHCRSARELIGIGYKDLGIFKRDCLKLHELIVDSVLKPNFDLFLLMLDSTKQGEGEIFQVFVR